MKDREEFITEMCLTYRHDYGITKEPGDPPWTSGMTVEDRKSLWLVMSQIYDHHIIPLVEEIKQKENNEQTTNRKASSKGSVLGSNGRQRKSRKRDS